MGFPTALQWTLFLSGRFFSTPLVTARHKARKGGWGRGESGGLGSRMLCFTLEKQKSEIRSPYTSPCFLLPQKGQLVSQGCSYSATPLGVGSLLLPRPPHFSRWTMTALRRLACCSVWLSSDSSMLGKVVMRTNSLAAMAGRAATTYCRRSDTLRDTTQHRDRKCGLNSRVWQDETLWTSADPHNNNKVGMDFHISINFSYHFQPCI